MSEIHWSHSEKKIARKAYDEAWDAAAAKLVAAFKRKAATVTSPSEIWEIEQWLREQRREMGEMFQYRYSRLDLLFAWAIRLGYLDEARLAGLAEDKLKPIRELASGRFRLTASP